MTLLAEVVSVLGERGALHAMIGATALAVLGSSRSTQDLDLLTTDRAVLTTSFWERLESTGAGIDLRTGDISDPLVGVARITRVDERPVDIIVGEAPWQERIIADASPHEVAGSHVPVVDAVGLTLLKLYAGGPQDRWDIEQLLALETHRQQFARTVEKRLADLPPRCRRLWHRIVTEGGPTSGRG